MKEKVLTGTVSVLVVAVALACFMGLFFSDAANTCCYTQIDNGKLKEQHSTGGVIDPTGGLPYAYELTAYDEDGAQRDVSFGMSRQLREGAFLRLSVNPMRGVVAWEEVEYRELPAAVQGCYPAPADAQP